MQLELSTESRAKLEEMLEELYTRYGLDDLTPSQMIDALLDLGVDLLVADDASMSVGRNRLLAYCGEKVQVS